MHKLITLFVILFLSWGSIFGQTKYEKEYRLKTKDVPQKALDFVEQLNFNQTIKWYREEGLNRISVEAKTKFHSKKYSIEFDSTGLIEDVEIIVNWEDLPKDARSNICQSLEEAHQKFRIVKIQIQYSGSPENIIQKVKGDTESEITTKYEIVVKAKTSGNFESFEYLFDAQGIFIQKAVIIFKNSDNLEY